jgi:hypothetical protein
MTELTAAHILSNAAEAGYLEWRSTRLYKNQHTSAVAPLHEKNKQKHTLDLLCIGRTRIMRIYLLGCGALVEADEPMEEVVACGVVVGSSLIVGEIVLKRRMREFLGEEIDLVQEQDLRGWFQYAKGRRERDECIIEVLTNYPELHIESKKVRASCIRF